MNVSEVLKDTLRRNKIAERLRYLSVAHTRSHETIHNWVMRLKPTELDRLELALSKGKAIICLEDLGL